MIEYRTKDFFERMFEEDKLDSLGDNWLIKWRGSQKLRYELCLDVLKPVLLQNELNKSLDTLDIGCALCNFTLQAWKLNRKNRFWAIDISENAISYVSRKYPQVHFAVAALPEIPFKDTSFDLIICFEVLYYLNSNDRQLGIKNMHSILCDGGILLLSVVLDNGKNYFAKEDIIKLISDFFDIQQIRYNYAKLYTYFESNLMIILKCLDFLQRIVNMSDIEYRQWLCNISSSSKKKLFSCFRKYVYGIPLCRQIITKSINLLRKVIRIVLGWKFLPACLFHITRLTLKEKGATHIIVLGKKRNVLNNHC